MLADNSSGRHYFLSSKILWGRHKSWNWKILDFETQVLHYVITLMLCFFITKQSHSGGLISLSMCFLLGIFCYFFCSTPKINALPVCGDQHVKQSYVMPELCTHHADQQTNSLECDTDTIQLWNSNLKHISHFDALFHFIFDNRGGPFHTNVYMG